MYQNTFDTYLIHVPTLLISCPVPVACQQPSVQTVLTKSSFCYHFLVDKRCSLTPLHVSPKFFCCCTLLLYRVGTCSHRLLFIFLDATKTLKNVREEAWNFNPLTPKSD